ncbi:MAG: prolyl oligopeptidase family serine peptidase [Coprobacter fastidiosus]
MNVGSRGSSQIRGRDFHCFGYGNLRDYPLADDKHAIETLARRYRFIDLDRVGIYGHSGGGFQTVAAMLTYPDFYKVGIAASGNHDNNLYIQWWGETYHGIKSHTDSITGKTFFTCKIPTNNELAKNLKGRLMLITGDVDKNVHPSTTFRLANALMKADKRFDMMVMPGMDHGVGNTYYYNLIRYYFVEHLLNPKKEHIDIIHHK